MVLRNITARDFVHLDWRETDEGGSRIVAELTCDHCGAYQAADCDPTEQKSRAVALAVRLFNAVGWRADARDRRLCPDCVRKTEK